MRVIASSVFLTLVGLCGLLEAASQDVTFRQCPPGERCVLVTHCSVVRFTSGNTRSLISTIFKLACGIRHDYLMICCPGAFARIKKSADSGGAATDGCVGSLSSGSRTLPWVATVLPKDRSGQGIKCIGSLVSEWYVLTSADCVSEEESSDSEQSDITVRLGDVNNGEGMERGVEYVSLHPSENAALLQLDEAVSITPYVAPICLEILTHNLESVPDYTQVIEVGWKDSPSDDQLTQTVSKLVPCPRPSEGTSCAMTTESPCHRTVGGSPLMKLSSNNSFTVIGVATSSAVDSQCGREPYVYTSLQHIRPWILDNILE